MTAFTQRAAALLSLLALPFAAWRGDRKGAKQHAKKVAGLVSGENNARRMEPYHELLGMVALRQKNWKQAISAFRQSDLTQMHNKFQPAGAGSDQGHGRGPEALQRGGAEQLQLHRFRAAAQRGVEEAGFGEGVGAGIPA